MSVNRASDGVLFDRELKGYGFCETKGILGELSLVVDKLPNILFGLILYVSGPNF